MGLPAVDVWFGLFLDGLVVRFLDLLVLGCIDTEGHSAMSWSWPIIGHGMPKAFDLPILAEGLMLRVRSFCIICYSCTIINMCNDRSGI